MLIPIRYSIWSLLYQTIFILYRHRLKKQTTFTCYVPTSPFHYDLERTSVPIINVELHTFLISSVIILKSIPFHLSILCKIEFNASNFEILDLFLNFKLTNLRIDFNSYQYFKYLKIKL